MIVRSLTEYCTLNMGQSPDSKTYNTQGKGLPFYQGNADFGETHPITRVWCSAPVKVAEDGDILISVRAPIGAMNMAVERCCIGRGLAALTPIRNKCSKQFLYYALQSKVDSLIAQGTGSTFKAISKKVLEATCIPAYSTIEQEQIAETIGRVDNAIAARRNQLLLLDQLVKSRFIELFGDQTANPYAWQQTSIGACCTLKSGTSLPADRENEGGAIPYVKVGDMNYPGNEQYITTSSRFVSEQTAGTGVFPVGTVVFPKRGGAIGTNKKRLTRIPICADLNVMGVTAGRRLTPQYLMAYFNTVDLGTLNNGSSVPQINNKDIAPLLICIPPMALQEQFAAFVEQTDKSKYYSSLSFRYCQAAANTYRQEWMTCRTSDF